VFGGIGMPELLLILVIILIIFGANKLPQIGEGFGKGIRNFKKATKEKDREGIEATSKKPEDTPGKNPLKMTGPSNGVKNRSPSISFII